MTHRLRLPALPRRDTSPLIRRPQRQARDSRAGFSLIELLTVIAIIAILAAIIFPVAGTVRRNAQQAHVISNLENIGAAIGLYEQDERRFPVTLGPIIFGSQGVTTQYNGLFPEYVRDKGAYRSPANDAGEDALFQVDPVQSAARGYIADPNSRPEGVNDPVLAGGGAFNGWNTMDGTPTASGTYMLHYSRFRTWNINDPDYKRQLGLRNPPADTVVTWNDTYVIRNEQTGAPIAGDYLVLFLNGNVQKWDVKRAASALAQKGVDLYQSEQIWRLEPR